ncbi:hypothetical protein NW752_003159 [Fusarium irregulare]|uniref:AB hydrolase-1 domain-containing protein n=1 Tax=Fusarium irregulare TaxID=2494466 RepID=A0A9W8UG45_9HYPO|nr:hypothetical protein NW766_000831 [Fusarium irregulare]KAJ4025684.1 hypothetical protein NW752_003159 [Fusarium irregulare]
MQPFQLTLTNNGTVTGLHSIPPQLEPSPSQRPLIIALHGGNYDSKYFDATPNYSASNFSSFFKVPFVAIDRPSYRGTSSILPVPEGSNFHRETAIMLHRYIIPKLWTDFGQPNYCNCVVLLCHSLGVIGGVIVGALHAQENAALYPLGGLIASGMGDKQSASMKNNPVKVQLEGHMQFDLDAKDATMFKPGSVAAEILEQTEALHVPAPLAETTTFPSVWLPVWKDEWASQVKAPVMFSLVDDDPFFVSDKKELDGCVRAFKNSSRVDGSLVVGAPHCIELSYWSRGWYARCFGFALECATGFGRV